MMLAADYRNTRQGEVVVVVGGGPSGPADVAELTARGEWGVVVSVNHHAARWLNAGFLVSVDRTFRLDRDRVLGRPVHVSPWGGDVEDFPPVRFRGHAEWSAFTALRWAEHLVAARIVLAGFDLYQGDRVYLDDSPLPAGLVAGSEHFSLAGQLDLWRRFRDYLLAPGLVEVVSGPLVDVFRPLDPRRVPLAPAQTYSGRQRIGRAAL